MYIERRLEHAPGRFLRLGLAKKASGLAKHEILQARRVVLARCLRVGLSEVDLQMRVRSELPLDADDNLTRVELSEFSGGKNFSMKMH